jgi:hypothetical protein
MAEAQKAALQERKQRELTMQQREGCFSLAVGI